MTIDKHGRHVPAEPVLVLDDNDAPTVVVIQNDLLRYLFSDDDEEPWNLPESAR